MNAFRAVKLTAYARWPVSLELGGIGHYHLDMAKPVTDPFVLHACEVLSSAGHCIAKRMFGGWGISVEGMNIAIIADDTLYLKSNAETEP